MNAPFLSCLVVVAATLFSSGCATSPAIQGSSQIEVVFAESQPPRAYEEIASVEARHWNLDEGIADLKSQAQELEADAIIAVEFSDYSDSYSDQFEHGQRRVSSGGQAVFELTGTAVRWASGTP